MFVDWLLASFHHLAVFSLAAILSAEVFLTGGAIDDRTTLRLARVDAWFGIMAAFALAPAGEKDLGRQDPASEKTAR